MQTRIDEHFLNGFLFCLLLGGPPNTFAESTDRIRKIERATEEWKLLLEQEEFAKAVEVSQQIHELFVAQFGKENGNTLRAKNYLEATKFIAKAPPAQQRNFALARRLERKANQHVAKRQYDEALRCRRDATRLLEQCMPRDKFVFAAYCRQSLTDLLCKIGQFPEAISLFPETIQDFKSTLGETHLQVLRAMQLFAVVLTRTDSDLIRAEKLNRLVIQEYFKLAAKPTEESISALRALGENLLMQYRHDEAREVLKLHAEVASERENYIVNFCSESSWNRREGTKKAIDLYAQLMNLVVKQAGASDPRFFAASDAATKLLAKTGVNDTSWEIQQRIHNGLRNTSAVTDPQRIKSASDL